MTDLSAHSLKPFVLRILNGPLHGCEFPLGEPTTLFVVGAVGLLGDAGLTASVPDDAIFIPLHEGGCNFELLADQATPDGLPLRLLDESVEVRFCTFQTRMQVGGLQIALRPEDQSWVPELLLPVADVKPAGTGALWRHAHSIRWLAGALVLAALAIVAVIGSMPEPAGESDVRALIAGASAEVTVLRGHDDSIYVFVSSERDAGWTRQVLMRQGSMNGKVLVVDQERRRLEKLLIDHEPQLAWHALDLKNPSVPRLLLSAQRNLLTPQKQKNLLDALLATAPYARDILIQIQDDTLLANLAQDGLQRHALAFERLEHADSVTFAIESNLQDSELAVARRYIDEFYQQWGDRYVHFTVELRDDVLKDKSFQTGPQGYIKTTASSWHFPTKR